MKPVLRSARTLVVSAAFVMSTFSTVTADQLTLHGGKVVSGRLEQISSTTVAWREHRGNHLHVPLEQVESVSFSLLTTVTSAAWAERLDRPQLRHLRDVRPQSVAGYGDADYLVLFRESHHQLLPDGRSVRRVHEARYMLRNGDFEGAPVGFSFLTPHEHGELLFARTITSYGERYVTEAAVRETVPHSRYPHYSQLRHVNFSMAAVSKGTVVEFAYQITTDAHLLFGGISGDELFLCRQPMEYCGLVVSLPAANTLFSKRENLEQPWFVEEVAGTRRYRLQYSPCRQRSAEPAMAPWWRDRPALFYSAGTDWSSMVANLRQLYRARARLDDLLSERSRAVIEPSLRGPAIAKRLFAFVQDVIRLVPVPAYQSSLIPRTPMAIYRSRRANYLDKAFLLWALMRHYGVASELALVIEKRHNRCLPEVPRPGPFFGAIVVGPDDQILAPYEGSMVYGDIPPQLQGTRALAITGGRLFRPLPLLPAQRETTTVRKTVAVSQQGFSVRHRIGATGRQQRRLRRYAGLPVAARRRVAENMLADIDSAASLRQCSFHNLADVTQPVEVVLEYDVDSALLAAPASLFCFAPRGLQLFEEPPARTLRRQSLLSFDSRHGLDVECDYRLPPGCTVQSVPAPYRVDTPHLFFSARYERRSRGVLFRLRFEQRSVEVPTDQYRRYRETLASIERYLERYVVVSF